MNLNIIDMGLLSATIVLLLMRVSRAWTFHSIARAQKRKQSAEQTTSLPHVSIIMTVHDQANELRRNLPLIFSQEYEGGFDVIVVNDASTDDTEEVLKLTQQEHSNFYYTFTPDTARYVSHKKLAITLGIKAAKSEWIMLTEADCAPTSNRWLATMCSNCHEGIEIVSGPTTYLHDSEKAYSHHIIFERLLTLVKQTSRALRGKKIYRASGCNLLIRKDMFLRNKGFSKNLGLKRGEDDLLLNETITRSNFIAECNIDAIVAQEEPIVMKIWKTDRIFYIETQKFLPTYARFVDKWLGAYNSLSMVLLPFVAFSGMTWSINTQNWYVIAIYPVALITVWITNGLAIKSSARAMNLEQSFFWSLPLHALLHVYEEMTFRFQHMIRHKDEFLRH